MWESAGLTTVIEECALVNGCDDAYADPDNDYPVCYSRLIAFFFKFNNIIL